MEIRISFVSIKSIFNKKNLGNELMTFLIKGSYNQNKPVPSYKFYSKIIGELLRARKNFGCEIEGVLVELRKYLRLDLKEARKIKDSFYGGTYQYYDHGIYTDMSQTRAKLESIIKGSNKVLNLFCYTGAFSLYSLKLGASEVVSVDLSEKYINWLEENISLNPDIESSKHNSMTCSTLDALGELKSKNREFDFIISDPPSSSSDGNTKSNALNDYQKTLPLITDLLSEGGKALVFLNTHKCSLKKFEDRIKQTISRKKLPLKISRRFFLDGDCPSQKGFPEGSYLKGILVEKSINSTQLNSQAEVEKEVK